MKLESGMLLARVYPASPANKLGLKYRDIIEKIDNVDVSKLSLEEFSKILVSKDSHKFKVRLSNGKTKKFVTTRVHFILPAMIC